MRALSRSRAQGGFTLVEAVVVIVITGIIAAGVAVFIRAPVEGYVDSVARAELTDAADTALRRLARDVNAALPNSLRQGPGAACIEFLPTLGGGRYRAAQTSGGAGDILDFTQNDLSFDVLAQNGLSTNVADYANTRVVVYNLGIPGADAYAGGVSAVVAGGSQSTIALTAPGKKFPLRSPGNRFHWIGPNSVIYTLYCPTPGQSGALLRSTRPISAA